MKGKLLSKRLLNISLLGLLLASLFTSSLSPYVANASSIYDTRIQKIDTLEGYDQDHNLVDLSSIYYMQMGRVINYLSENGNYPWATSCKNIIENATNLGVVIQVVNPNSNTWGRGINISVFDSPNLYFDGDAGGNNYWRTGTDICQIQTGLWNYGTWYNQSDENDIATEALQWTGQIATETDLAYNGSITKYYSYQYSDPVPFWAISAQNVVYPSGYEGVTIPDQADKLDYSPKASINVDNRDILGAFLPQSLEHGVQWPPGATGISWTLENASNEVLFTSADEDQMDMFIEVTVPELGIYTLRANYYTTPPFIIDSSAEIHELVFDIDVNGETYATGTGQKYQNCNDLGECQQYTGLEDCSIYGWDVAQRLTCEIQNAGRKLKNFIQSAILPVGDQRNKITNFSTGTYGLTAVITSPLSLFNQLQTAEQTCIPLALPLPYVEESLTLPCMHNFYTSTLGAFFTMYQTIITGVIWYYVMLNMLKFVKDQKSPDYDKLEATDL